MKHASRGLLGGARYQVRVDRHVPKKREFSYTADFRLIKYHQHIYFLEGKKESGGERFTVDTHVESVYAVNEFRRRYLGGLFSKSTSGCILRLHTRFPRFLSQREEWFAEGGFVYLIPPRTTLSLEPVP